MKYNYSLLELIIFFYGIKEDKQNKIKFFRNIFQNVNLFWKDYYFYDFKIDYNFIEKKFTI
jgi:hypothetical protein